MSKPSAEPPPALCRSHRRATTRAPAATGRRANTPSRSATWSRTFTDASASETAAASLAPSPLATGAVRIPRSGHGPAVRRAPPAVPAGLCASTSTEMISPS
ncbi:hypothetical protein GCM10010441_19160 [Kitasatospora paracochleata]